jgi:hypothetical protein
VTGFGALLSQAATIERFAGAGAYGPVFDSPQTGVPCRLESDRQLVLDAAGAQVISASRLFLGPGVAVTPESRVTVDGQTTTVISVATIRGATAAHHLEVRLR